MSQVGTSFADMETIVGCRYVKFCRFAATESGKKVLTMTEYIDKLSVVNRLIDLENEFKKSAHGGEKTLRRVRCWRWQKP